MRTFYFYFKGVIIACMETNVKGVIVAVFPGGHVEVDSRQRAGAGYQRGYYSRQRPRPPAPGHRAAVTAL